jgi:flavin reductase (DIM6/NTAB) family NADH-FMN oxidoreductase RutF
VDAAAFRRALGQFATGVNVVTTLAPDGSPLALTVNAFCSVSLAPPLVLVSIDERSETHAGFRGSGVFGVSVLAEGQAEWSRRFAVPGRTKFEGVELLRGGATGVGLVPDALVHLECKVVSSHAAGDHVLYVGEVERLSAWPGRPLLYHGSAYRRLGEGGP